MLQKNIISVNPFFLLINEINGFIEEKGGDKYLNISLTNSNNEVLKNMHKSGGGIKDCLTKINDNKLKKHGKDCMKTKFNSDDNLPLNKILKFCVLTVIIRNIFEKDGKYYSGIYLDDCLYEI